MRRYFLQAKPHPMTERQSDLNLNYLEAELARVDVRLVHAVRRWQRAGQDPTDSFRGLYVSDAEAQRLVNRPLGTGWGQTVGLDPEETATQGYALMQAESNCERLREEAHGQGEHLRLVDLCQTFGLDGFDLDALLICLAPYLDVRYERVYGYLQDDVTRKRPAVNLILDLLCDPGIARLPALSHFSQHAPLFRFHSMETS